MTDIIPRIISFDNIADAMDWFSTEDCIMVEEGDLDLVVYVIPLAADCAACTEEIPECTAAYLLRGTPRVICQDCFNRSGIVLDPFSQERIIAAEEQYK